MEDKATLIEPLFERLEAYGKTSFELYKLKAVDKVTGLLSTMISNGIAIIILFLFVIIINIGIAMWLGDLLGKMYYGFFCLAGFYGIVALIIYASQDSIKRALGNSIVTKLLE